MAEKQAKKPVDNKKNYVCNDCGYKFKRAPGTSSACPYCSSKNTEEYIPQLASDLLRSVHDD